MSTRFVDLSHVVSDGLRTYPGLPSPEISDHLARAHAEEVYGPGNTFQIGMITMCANTGTYLDVPFHRYADGYDLCGLDLSRVSHVPAVLVDARGETAIGPDRFAGLDLAGTAVLVRTDHSDRWGTEAYFEDHPHLTGAAAEALVAAGVACVGIDSLNIDQTAVQGRPVHSTLLAAGIPIIEHLTALGELPAAGFSFTAVPPKVEGMGTFTVRAHARIE
ncbi:MAG: cyclase family protein [Acidimicrobiales bacterium]